MDPLRQMVQIRSNCKPDPTTPLTQLSANWLKYQSTHKHATQRNKLHLVIPKPYKITSSGQAYPKMVTHTQSDYHFPLTLMDSYAPLKTRQRTCSLSTNADGQLHYSKTTQHTCSLSIHADKQLRFSYATQHTCSKESTCILMHTQLYNAIEQMRSHTSTIWCAKEHQ